MTRVETRDTMRNRMRAEIRRRWKPLSRRALGCKRGARNRKDVWLLASDMPAIILRVIARELAAGRQVQIPGFGTFHSRFGGTTVALQGNRPGHKPLPSRRMAQVRVSKSLIRAVPGDGTRWSLKFRASPLLKKSIQPGGPPLKRTRRKAVRPETLPPAPAPAPRPSAPLAEIILR
ncbi:hypothetical protein EZH22_13995 [Xanthobacter dioxanivorans]|uniref:DNA-binding protein n=1 Tax=Xanthobacter dioxanivorans TaxID=2528964 RepID=A0A974SLF3_9HYPH|nr:hypothetical protein [Xanthobacter dioxanivorans]QRG09264.1 hypothetical protein EZH22_13995 [Xanthobacter dioxanivorans]